MEDIIIVKDAESAAEPADVSKSSQSVLSRWHLISTSAGARTFQNYLVLSIVSKVQLPAVIKDVAAIYISVIGIYRNSKGLYNWEQHVADLLHHPQETITATACNNTVWKQLYVFPAAQVDNFVVRAGSLNISQQEDLLFIFFSIL